MNINQATVNEECNLGVGFDNAFKGGNHILYRQNMIASFKLYQAQMKWLPGCWEILFQGRQMLF